MTDATKTISDAMIDGVETAKTERAERKSSIPGVRYTTNSPIAENREVTDYGSAPTLVVHGYVVAENKAMLTNTLASNETTAMALWLINRLGIKVTDRTPARDVVSSFDMYRKGEFAKTNLRVIRVEINEVRK